MCSACHKTTSVDLFKASWFPSPAHSDQPRPFSESTASAIPFMCVTAPASRGWRDPGRCTGCWWLRWRWYSQMDAKPCAGFSWWSPSYQRPHLHGDACHRCTPSGSAVRPGACYSLAKPPALRLDPSPCQTSWRSCCRHRSWWRWRQTERMVMTDGAEWCSASKTHSSCVSGLNASYALTCRSCSKRTRTCQRCSRFHRESTAYSLNIHEPVEQSDSQSFFCRTIVVKVHTLFGGVIT